MMKTRLVLAAVCVMALAASAQVGDSANLDETFEKDVLVIESTELGCFRFDVYLAVTRSQQLRGLMFVRDLPEWTGMLFLYERASVRSIWMKNTYIPLDILFARGDGTVSSIQANAEPLSLTSMSAIEPVNYVLELNAGTAERLSIKVGSRLIVN
jgi:uncharacterized protein